MHWPYEVVKQCLLGSTPRVTSRIRFFGEHTSFSERWFGCHPLLQSIRRLGVWGTGCCFTLDYHFFPQAGCVLYNRRILVYCLCGLKRLLHWWCFHSATLWLSTTAGRIDSMTSNSRFIYIMAESPILLNLEELQSRNYRSNLKDFSLTV